MGEKRNITKEDIYLKARILSEGVRLDVRKPSSGTDADGPSAFLYMGQPIVLDGCDVVVATPPNPHARLVVTVEGERVTVTDEGKVLATAHLEERAAWRDETLSNGQPIEAALPGMSATIINILFHYSCHNWNSGRGCRYCGLFAFPGAKQMADLPRSTLAEMAARQAEALKIATDNGWRGALAVSGGALPPSRRGEFLELLDTVMAPLRETLDEEVFSELHIMLNAYAPEDFSEMEAWKELGINATAMDLEVMDPAYFAAVCPGKHAYKPLEYWKEAQIASTEIFGPGRGTTTTVVAGVEPMSTLVEGIDERLSKGVFPTPNNFMITPGSGYAGFRPPSTEWYVEAAEKMADSFFRHADKLDAPLTADNRPGYTRTGRSFHIMLVGDEVTRRAQEMGQFPPGLPKQDA